MTFTLEASEPQAPQVPSHSHREALAVEGEAMEGDRYQVVYGTNEKGEVVQANVYDTVYCWRLVKAFSTKGRDRFGWIPKKYVAGEAQLEAKRLNSLERALDRGVVETQVSR